MNNSIDNIYYKDLNVELVGKLIEALESGKYKQDNGFLKINDGYCCLGVLCDILGVNWIYDKDCARFRGDGECYILPYHIQEKIGCVESAFHIPLNILTPGERNLVTWDKDENIINLAALNDKGYTFEQIANILRRLIQLKKDYDNEK